MLRVMIRQNLLSVEELSGDFVTTTHETCMTHCIAQMCFTIPSFNADPYVAVPLNNASVSEPFRVFCIIHWTLIVICHNSELNFLSSVAVFLFGLLLQKVLAYCALTILALKENLINRRSVPTREHQ
jgi:hypothetical protein